MKSFSRRTALLIALCIAVLAMRATGVHLHLCLDGQEAPQALHWSDAGLHGDVAHVAGTHADVDLSLSAEALTKGVKSGFDLPFLLFALLGLFVPLFVPGRLAAAQHQAFFSAPSRYFQPPLRAPPL